MAAPLSLASNFSQWPLAVLQRKIPCGPKSIFPIDHHCKRDACKTVDRTPPTINMVNYYSLYCTFLSHGGLIFVKLFQSPETVTLLRIFSGPHNPEVTQKLETFFGVCARRAVPLDWIGAILESGIQVKIIHPWVTPSHIISSLSLLSDCLPVMSQSRWPPLKTPLHSSRLPSALHSSCGQAIFSNLQTAGSSSEWLPLADSGEAGRRIASWGERDGGQAGSGEGGSGQASTEETGGGQAGCRETSDRVTNWGVGRC